MTLPAEVIIQAAQCCRDVYGWKRDWLVDNSIPGYSIVAVEGTKEATDWITNIKFLFRSEDTHRGFKDNAVRIMSRLWANYQMLDGSRLLVLTGHSLGGATATVMADLIRDNGRQCAVVTLGSPRPGGRGLRKRIAHIEHHRFVHSDDVVPKSPPWLTGYVHTHPPIKLADANGEKWFDKVSDHDVGAYCDALALTLPAP